MRILYILFLALLVAGCGSKAEQEETIRPVFYHEAGNSFHATRLSFPGVTRAAEEVRLSFKVGGTVDRLNVEMGDTVRAGDCLVRLDSTDYYVQYAKALSALNNARAQLANARSEFERMENLYIKNNISLRDYERVKTQLESAEAMEKSAVAQVRAAQNQMDYTCLKAPFPGVVNSVFISESEMIGAGKPALMLSSLNNIEVRTTVPENIVGRLKAGMEANVSLISNKDMSLKGHITEIGTTAQSASAYPVVIGMQTTGVNLYSGMTATITFLLDSSAGNSAESMIIPEDAVNHDRQGDYVFVAAPFEGDVFVVKRKQIVSGELTPEGVQIREGLSKGDLVITAGLRFMYEGRKVRLLDGVE
ncbi:efflux RND transporter periplasmic adaptor subunit [Marinilabilia salmonicolor]|uniref:efflux RND transporter periplasmic adaptor subunit n=1 Tax=Marinilabilia salmonicolor TaxID=989 RepID=UPI000299D956|nr:efflux RND transporter periplasmic adaptor subunit [Marinilabilia salmonicolor]